MVPAEPANRRPLANAASAIRRLIVASLALYATAITAMSIVNVVAPQQTGPLAASQVFAPHAFAPVLAIGPIALWSRSRALRAGTLVALAVGVVRFAPGLVSMPAPPPAQDESIVRVMSWNLEIHPAATSEIISRLEASHVGILALQELSRTQAAAIQADPWLTANYGHLALVPSDDAAGLGILSKFPITEAAAELHPALQSVAISLPDRHLTVINAHPFAPGIQSDGPLPFPFTFSPKQRDADIGAIREWIDREIAAERRLIVVGDFNVSDREPGYWALSRDLWDAHAEVGVGTGSTWRPPAIDFLPFGLLRIDYVLGGPGTRPLSVSEDCRPGWSDHCSLVASVAVR
jgi:vancomycin resistance protein VanJ